MDKQQQQQQPVNPNSYPNDRLFRKHISTLKRSHYIFMFIQALMSTICVVAVAIGVNYKSIFQSGLLVYFHVLTGITIGIYIAANTILRISFNRITENLPVFTDPNGKKFSTDDVKVLQEYEVYSAASPAIITTAILSSCFISYYIYNPVFILAVICPMHHHPHLSPPPHHHDIKGASNLYTPQGDTISNIQAIISYTRLPKDEFYAKRSVIILDYNETSHQVTFKQKDSDPNLYENWYEGNEWIRFLNDDKGGDYSVGGINGSVRYKDISTYQSSSSSSSQESGIGDIRNTVCYNQTPKTFRIIENEINRYLIKSIESRQNKKTFRIKDHHPNPHMNNEEEDDIFIDLFTKYLCRNEYGYMITILVFIITFVLVNIAIVIYNIWLRCIYISNRFSY